MPPLSVMIKPSSSMCNMHCDYCFYKDEAEQRQQASYGFMTEKTLKNVIRRTLLRAEGYISYNFQGGEPTLRGLDFFKRAVELERQYNKNGLPVHNALQTNGFLIDDRWCGFFVENGFLVGLSIDGTHETHDALRHTAAGGPTFERILNSARLLEKHGVEFNILTVVNSLTAAHIGEIYKFYRSQGWMYQQYIACLDPLDAPHGTMPYALIPEDYGRFLINLFDLWYADWKKGRQPYIRMFENYIGILMGHVPEACDQRGVCSVQYVVEADGSVYPCDFYVLDKYRLGNFNENLLDSIDEERVGTGFIEESLAVPGECRSCAYFYLCRGGCRRNRCEAAAGGMNYFCPAYKMFFDARLPALKEMAAGVGKLKA